jgi:hypothetical protein
MCSGGGSSRAPDPPKERPPQVLRNPYLDSRLNLVNRGIGALTFRAGDRLTFNESTGSLKDNTQIGMLRPGSAQGTGKFQQLGKGMAWLKQEKQRRLEASKAYQDEQAAKKRQERIRKLDDRSHR